MREPNGVALFSTLRWPKHALGERPLLVIESYDSSVWRLDDAPSDDLGTCLRERGFEPLRPDAWSFPYLEDHLVAVNESSSDFAFIDEAADELFRCPLRAILQD